jgi:hypothetical protein
LGTGGKRALDRFRVDRFRVKAPAHQQRHTAEHEKLQEAHARLTAECKELQAELAPCREESHKVWVKNKMRRREPEARVVGRTGSTERLVVGHFFNTRARRGQRIATLQLGVILTLSSLAPLALAHIHTHTYTEGDTKTKWTRAFSELVTSGEFASIAPGSPLLSPTRSTEHSEEPSQSIRTILFKHYSVTYGKLVPSHHSICQHHPELIWLIAVQQCRVSNNRRSSNSCC